MREWSDGDAEALDRLMPFILDEVRDLARRAMAMEAPGHTLQPTALVNEVYMRLIDRKVYWWRNRREFFASLAQLIRQILVDHARRRKAAKRGGGEPKLSLEEGVFHSEEPHPELLALNDALEALEKLEPNWYQVVMLRYFMGFTQKEIARELGVSINTVGRWWQAAKRWLRREMRRSSTDQDS